METKDIMLYQTGSGGDMAILNNDLVLGDVLFQQVHLALFGGNLKANTESSYIGTEERFDYWGNSLIWRDSRPEQFNSNTERTLRNVVLNSSGRLAILQAVNTDLEAIKGFVNFMTSVSLLGINSVKITIELSGKTNTESKTLEVIFDNSKNELILQQKI